MQISSRVQRDRDRQSNNEKERQPVIHGAILEQIDTRQKELDGKTVKCMLLTEASLGVDVHLPCLSTTKFPPQREFIEKDEEKRRIIMDGNVSEAQRGEKKEKKNVGGNRGKGKGKGNEK